MLDDDYHDSIALTPRFAQDLLHDVPRRENDHKETKAGQLGTY